MSEFLEVQDELEDLIRNMGQRDKFSVYDGSVPTGKNLKSENGWFWPYVVFGFGGKSEAANKIQGIGSSRDDVKWTSLNFFCAGDSPRTVRKLKDILRIQFEGYEPRPGWGEFTEVLSGDFGIKKPDPDLIPLRYGETLIFKSLIDF